MGGLFDGTRQDQLDEIWTIPSYSPESGVWLRGLPVRARLSPNESRTGPFFAHFTPVHLGQSAISRTI